LYVWGFLLFSVFFQGKIWSFSSQQSGNTDHHKRIIVKSLIPS